MITNYPTKTCSICGGTTWWYSILEPTYKGAAEWLCGICQPPPSDIAKLRMRIVRGNWVLSQRRRDIDAMPTDTDEQREIVYAERRAWGEGIDKLQVIGRELKQLNTDCPYIENSKKIKKCIFGVDESKIECFACPNDYWWRQEVEDYFGNKGE